MEGVELSGPASFASQPGFGFRGGRSSSLGVVSCDSKGRVLAVLVIESAFGDHPRGPSWLFQTAFSFTNAAFCFSLVLKGQMFLSLTSYHI